MSALCGVCSQEPPKYKCPSCELQYCSFTCYKSHKTTHEADQPRTSPSPSTAPSLPGISAPDPTASNPPTNAPLPTAPLPITALPTDPTFQRLLTQRPTLRSQLRKIYTATLEPPPRDNSAPTRYGRGGQRGFRGRYRNRPVRPWTQETGDRYALRLLSEAMAEEREGEGVREFVACVGRVWGGRVEEEQGWKGRVRV
ncbi:hypothetical protein W97_03970 [Coniosporium apollinis CBS 100218]|uniref:HIT-type domain-containing protein n=1 Tax=Coniosporium apollinis (strain CBS 100218) TaxID=1168221 RepID=R7YS31_CONA1|nr:uncharacterized protein W97_03970 [Coniosporium apollinis CBS 100218]EON64737.1 hypothetical protein W97_03970 [Coniosporium apollinis CBS 100218]